jgi:hypothetical protein
MTIYPCQYAGKLIELHTHVSVKYAVLSAANTLGSCLYITYNEFCILYNGRYTFYNRLNSLYEGCYILFNGLTIKHFGVYLLHFAVKG